MDYCLSYLCEKLSLAAFKWKCAHCREHRPILAEELEGLIFRWKIFPQTANVHIVNSDSIWGFDTTWVVQVIEKHKTFPSRQTIAGEFIQFWVFGLFCFHNFFLTSRKKIFKIHIYTFIFWHFIIFRFQLHIFKSHFLKTKMYPAESEISTSAALTLFLFYSCLYSEGFYRYLYS